MTFIHLADHIVERRGISILIFIRYLPKPLVSTCLDMVMGWLLYCDQRARKVPQNLPGYYPNYEENIAMKAFSLLPVVA